MWSRTSGALFASASSGRSAGHEGGSRSARSRTARPRSAASEPGRPEASSYQASARAASPAFQAVSPASTRICARSGCDSLRWPSARESVAWAALSSLAASWARRSATRSAGSSGLNSAHFAHSSAERARVAGRERLPPQRRHLVSAALADDGGRRVLLRGERHGAGRLGKPVEEAKVVGDEREQLLRRRGRIDAGNPLRPARLPRPAQERARRRVGAHA